MKPLYASEKLLPGPPYRGCGIASDWNATMIATANEAGLNRHARQVGQGGRRAALKRGWAAFASQVPADENGWVDRNDIPRIHRAMFGNTIPQPGAFVATPEWTWDHIGPSALSLAIDTGAVDATDAVRRFVGPVAHQVVAWQKRTRDGTRQVRIIDPMYKPSNVYVGHWVDWSSLRKCALAIGNGKVLGFEYPAGGWTQAQLTSDRKTAVINEKNRTIARIRKQRDEAMEIVREQREKITELEAGSDCDAAVEAVLDALHEWELEQRL
jgi:hypothetical protein